MTKIRIKPLFKNPLENIVAYSPPQSEIYLGSPGITLLPNDRIAVSHDFFGPKSPCNKYGMPNTTRIYLSSDCGKSWKMVSEIREAYWSTLFYFKDSLYLLGTSAKYGDIVIRRSNDYGKTWTIPLDEDSGLLFRGGDGNNPPNYHCAPVPILVYRNRIWRGFEDNVTASWPEGFHTFVISSDIGKDLLKSSSWIMSNKLAYNPSLDSPEFGERAGWLEGNVVAGPDGDHSIIF
ncbi:MAG TPA: hypothetical protein ENG40_01360 [Thermoprotei archaeon]|nr:hypothetical protein [Thermoprotei archaeon]